MRTEYNSFSEIVPATNENMIRFCKESNLIEGISKDDPTSPYISQHLAAFEYMRTNERISIRELHRRLMGGLIEAEGESAGEYRRHYVRIGQHTPPPPGPTIELLMGELEEYMESALGKGYEQHMEWEFHNRFEVIHPFVDGNGRTGRLLLNFVRMHYFPEEIVIVNSQNRQLYYQMLDEYRMK